MTRRLRHLLLATLEDPFNPRSWSGTPFNMRVALEARVEKVSVLANLKPKRTLVTAALRALLGGSPPRYPLFLTAPAQREFARRTQRAIEELRPDALLTISSHNMVRMGPPAVPAFMVTRRALARLEADLPGFRPYARCSVRASRGSRPLPPRAIRASSSPPTGRSTRRSGSTTCRARSCTASRSGRSGRLTRPTTS